MNNLYRFFILVLASFISAEAYGLCLDGKRSSVNSEFNASNIVILGLVTSSQDISSPDDPQGIDKTIYDIKVEHYFKGTNNTNLKITSENTSSRFPMNVGTKYLLFLKSFSANGEFFVDSCGNSGEIENKKTEIDNLSKFSTHDHGK